MFAEYVLEFTSAEYKNKILVIDDAGFEGITHYSAKFEEIGFKIVRYNDDLDFRINYEEALNRTEDKLLIIATSRDYIPYDVLQSLYSCSLSFEKLFPKLNPVVLKNYCQLDLDLLCTAYQDNFDEYSGKQQTEDFLRNKVYGKENVSICIKELRSEILKNSSDAKNYQDWIRIAEDKSRIDVLAAAFQVEVDTSEINRFFQKFILSDFGKLSFETNRNTPILVSRAMEYMHDTSENNFVVIVMDGMSEFDWRVLSSSFNEIPFEKTGIFAMIPTITSVSRQCLMGGKYPYELRETWKQSKEKQEFIDCAKKMGYSDSQIAYERGYGASFSPFVRCAAIIINDVDDMVHAQKQGRTGMFNDIKLLAIQKKLAQTVKRLREDGFDVYITSDHGNTPCTGTGKLVGTGLEMETKSHRMLVLQNFADKRSIQSKYNLIDYPKYYLNKNFDYLICDEGNSFDAKGEKVMTHGGISIDEVIVPFVKITK